MINYYRPSARFMLSLVEHEGELGAPEELLVRSHDFLNEWNLLDFGWNVGMAFSNCFENLLSLLRRNYSLISIQVFVLKDSVRPFGLCDIDTSFPTRRSKDNSIEASLARDQT